MTPQFQATFEEVLDGLERIHREDYPRWHETLNFLHGLLYHYRRGDEQQPLRDSIKRIAEADKEHREELQMSFQTWGDLLREEGRIEAQKEEKVNSKRENLSRLLVVRFGKLSKKLQQKIEAEKDFDKLSRWFDSACQANAVADIDFS